MKTNHLIYSSVILFVSALIFLTYTSVKNSGIKEEVSLKYGFAQKAVSNIDDLEMIIYSIDFSKPSETQVLFLTIKKRYEENISAILSNTPEETLNRIIKFSDSVWTTIVKYLETGILDNQETLQLKGDTKVLKRVLTLALTGIRNEENKKKSHEFMINRKLNIIATVLFTLSFISIFTAFRKVSKELSNSAGKIAKAENITLEKAIDDFIQQKNNEKIQFESDYRREHFILTRYIALLDSLSTSIIELDTAKKIIYANDRFAKTFTNGKKPVGENITDIIPDLNPDSTRLSQSGNIYWIEKKELSESTFIVFVDITEQEAMSDRLISSERLITMGELASRVTHEIRNPLSTIKLNSQYLYSNVQTIDPSEIQTFLELIIKETARLEEITGKYMGMSGYGRDSSKNSVLPEDLTETVNFLKTETDKRGIKIITGEVISHTLSMRKSSLKEIVINIVKNGWEEIEKDGTIMISTETDETKLLYKIHFDDSGKGVPDSEKELIFRKFFTKKSGGTGIGLAHSKKTAEENGGRLTVKDSPLLSGARFTIELPYSAPSGKR